MNSRPMSRKKRFSILVFVSAVVLCSTSVILRLNEHLTRFQFYAALVCIFFVLGVLEVIVISIESRRSMTAPPDSLFELAGKTGVVEKSCAPEGTVKIDSTLWSAVSSDGSPLQSGESVEVESIQGLKLYVRRRA